MAAAIIELDPLPDPVGTTAKNDDFFPVGGLRLVLRFAKGRGLIGRIHIRGARFKFSGASVDPLEDRTDAQPVAHGADFGFCNPTRHGANRFMDQARTTSDRPARARGEMRCLHPTPTTTLSGETTG